MSFLDKVKAAAVSTGVDMTKATAGGGGGDYEPLPAGPCRLRFVGYIELGKHIKTYLGKPSKPTDRVRLIFEVSGKNYPPKEVDGVKYPNLISIDENRSLNEKAWFFKLFGQMNWQQKASHIAELLGQAYLGEIVHRKWKKKTDPAEADKWTGLDVTLFKKGVGYTIAAPLVRDPETDEMMPVKVADPISPIKGFIWDSPDAEMWASIFIDGEYPERKDDKGNVTAPAKSKNQHQLKIASAVNFKGSPIDTMLKSQGVALELTGLVEEEPSEDGDAAPAPAPVAEPAKFEAAGDDAVNALLGG